MLERHGDFGRWAMIKRSSLSIPSSAITRNPDLLRTSVIARRAPGLGFFYSDSKAVAKPLHAHGLWRPRS